MGFGMCLNIHAKIPSDAELFICDVNQSALDKFVQESPGAAKVEKLQTPKEIAEHSVSIDDCPFGIESNGIDIVRQDIIITMLPTSKHVQTVYYAGDNSLVSANKSKGSQQGTKLFIECSTIDPVVSREVGGKIQESGLGQFADAAVSVSILLVGVDQESC